MNIGEKQQNSRASEDLTVVLLRGNGSPKSFRISLPALHRSLTALGFAFAFAILVALVAVGFALIRPSEPPPPAPAAPAENAAGNPGLWQQLQGSFADKPSGGAGGSSELEREVEGLRQDLARLHTQIDERKPLPRDGTLLLQLLGPRAVPVKEAETSIRIRNPKTLALPQDKQVALTFELHNMDPRQLPERGYIVVLAQATDLLATYPSNTFKPGDNILLDFTKGETFAVARFREVRATFPTDLLEGRKVSYQILLFGHDGKVIGNTFVEAPR